MEEYFLKAISGNRGAVKGIYACSIASAYHSVNKIIKDENEACSIIKEAYFYAFSCAKSEEDFFNILNVKAESSCNYYSKKTNSKMEKIVAINTYYADLNSMDIPQSLKDFAISLSEIVSASGENREDQDLSEQNSVNPDFKDFENFKVEEEITPEEKLASILKKEPSAKTTQQKIVSGQEKRKDKKHLIIILVCVAVILVCGIVGYILAKKTNRLTNPTTTTLISTTVPTTTKTYAPNEYEKAFKDYLNTAIIPNYGRVSNEKTVAYDENGAVGINYLNGVASAKIFDFDKDGEKELMLILVSAFESTKNNKKSFIYDYTLNLYDFDGSKVVPSFENYLLMEYKTDNRIDDYTNNNFKFFVRFFYKNNIPTIYTEASGNDYSMVSYASYYGEKIHDAKKFLYYAFNESSFIYLECNSDGTYTPLYCIYSNYAVDSTEKIDKNMVNELKTAGFNLSKSKLSYTSSADFIKHFNSEFKETGLQLGASTKLSFDTSSKKDYLIYLSSKVEKVGELEWNTVVSIKDYTSLSKLAK